ncbi:MAG: hypothetical protein A2Y40_00165 [Candidatus Margulisbacteria bacterium GWF2_35_9]|nr:MAG: hypothetical protein A2Y40_00165 [Candidatus Margulisbacteria bacterium GWF2_35_9]
MEIVSILFAVGAGIITFLSPCMLPLIPAYLSFMTGLSAEDISDEHHKQNLLIKSLLFVLGFTIIFVSLGATATIIGQFLEKYYRVFHQLSGIIVVIFGLFMAEIIHFKLFNIEKKINFKNKGKSNLAAFILGLVFAFGWTPCVGPILASVLVMASSQSTIYQGILLLFFYSMGIGLPFVFSAVAISKFFHLLKKYKKHMHKVKIISGIILIIIGLLIVTGVINTSII